MNKKEKKELSIILVNWNCGQVIIDCINSLIYTIKKVSYEIIVVDNNSKDGSIEKIISDYPQIKVIKNDFNNMFAGANNQGYAISEGKYIFILNTDTVVTNTAIDNLINILKNTNESVVTCTLLNRDGSIQYNMHRSFPTFMRVLTGLIYKRWRLFGLLSSVRKYLLIDNKFNNDFYLDQAAGAAIMLKREAIKKIVYLFDEKNFPLFFNDVDLCYRIKKAGLKILCKADIKIYHLKGESIKKNSYSRHLKIYIPSLLKFFLKHKSLIFKSK